jgi:hypothetical protein
VPLDLEILEILPSTPTPTFTNDLVLLSLGMLDGGDSATFDFTIQPTNSGNFTLSTTYGAIGLVDTNSANNVASTNFDVVDILSTNLLATNLTSQAFNPQTGLMEQTIRLSNAGTNSVPAARVIVTGLTNTLFNAVGTNYGDPFVLHAAQLDPGQSVELLLEYFNPTRLPTVVSNSAYIAVGVPAVDLTPASTNALAITNIVCLPSGAALIEFPSTPNASYTILYSEEAAFTNVLSAVPAIIAPADRVQWIDSGPPKTISHPTNVTMRFYRVLSLP